MDIKGLTLEKELIKHNNYELNTENGTYILLIEIYSDDTILFKLNQTNVLTNIQYKKEFKYEVMINNILYSLKAIYPDISKVFEFIDSSIKKKGLN